MSWRANKFFDQANWLLILCVLIFLVSLACSPFRSLVNFARFNEFGNGLMFLLRKSINHLETNLFLRSHVPRLRKWVGCWREFWSGTQRDAVRGQAELLNCHAPLGQRHCTYSHWKKKNTRTMNERLTRFLLLDFLTAIVISNLL